MNREQVIQIVCDLFNKYQDKRTRQEPRYADEPPQDVLQDIMTDLRHFCQRQNLDFDKAMWLSEMHFEAETE